MSGHKPSAMVDQTTAALTDRRSEWVRRTSDLSWPEARLLAEAIAEANR